jgi:hypothetical protein|tara:strand:- start:75 stop:419 length:345 start_codon:yes stop_codon:yes gene_type:complete
MSFFSRIGDFASTAYDATKSFFQSDTAKTIASGAKDVLEVMKGGSESLENFKPQGLVPTKADFSSAISASRSRAGRPSFGDIGEATYYKYAQLQNTIRYLYGTKSRYKSIAKDK